MNDSTVVHRPLMKTILGAEDHGVHHVLPLGLSIPSRETRKTIPRPTHRGLDEASIICCSFRRLQWPLRANFRAGLRWVSDDLKND